MPKTSPLTCGKILGNFFVIFVLLVISFIYSNVFRLYWPRRAGILYLELAVQVFLSSFHLSLFLLLWSFFKAMLTDPGIVPPLWGFYMGDSENKRRRYCLMCHVFKPERCHHCSACNRCVLNMDHHCRKIQLAWINNCVGFYNRKFFILLLVYVLISLYQAFIALVWPVKEKIFELVKSRSLESYDDLVLFGAFTLNFLLTVMITMFFKFHVRLILTNSTTIENMDKKNAPKDTYNKGTANNWFQVFGKNKWLWMLPMTGVSGKPIGDGVIWTQENFNNIESEVPENENDIRKSMTLSGTGSLAQQLAKDNNRIGSPLIGPGMKVSQDLLKREEAGTKPGSFDSNVFSKN